MENTLKLSKIIIGLLIWSKAIDLKRSQIPGV